MAGEQKVGEVIEACTTDFVVQCYELYQYPSLGGLVKIRWDSDKECQDCIYGIVYKIMTAGSEPGRRPIARGRDESSEDEIYRSNPQLTKLLKSEFYTLVIGYKTDNRTFQCLPPRPPRIHSFVFTCASEEVKQFSRSLDFLNTLLKARLDIPVEELTAAVLRQISQIYGAEKHAFLVSAGKELATLLSQDYSRLKAILKGLKYDVT